MKVRKRLFQLSAFILFSATVSFADGFNRLQCLVDAYPDRLSGFDSKNLIFKDGSTLAIEADHSNFMKLLADAEKVCRVPKNACKNYESSGAFPCALLSELSGPFDRFLDQVSVLDMMGVCYPKGKKYYGQLPKNFDPGRARSEEFFRMMYGNTSAEVSNQLRAIKFAGIKSVSVTRKNKADVAFEAVSRELEELAKKNPAMKKFFSHASGTFNWRTIAGTKRLSCHSFGMTIDIDAILKEYWQYSGQKPKDGVYQWKNSVPWEIVEIFERHGFIWGGKWHHFDSMHFEYRPELLDDRCACKETELKPVGGALGAILEDPTRGE